MTEPARDLMAELEASLEHVRVKLWDCFDAECMASRPKEPHVRIEWVGPIARCLDCGRTNAAVVAKHLEARTHNDTESVSVNRDDTGS